MMLQDIRSHTFAPFDPGPLRLISLVPSTTETLFALGRGQDLIGYTRFCVHPSGEITPEKWIGGTKNPKISLVVERQPDLVLANREENRLEDISALEEAGIPVWVAEPRSVPDAIADLRAMSMLVGRSERGEALARQVEQALADARAQGMRAPLTFAYLIWRDPWMVAGQETFISSLL
ncbi:MAG: helical backbone metal receptor, partial [Ardenticatenaceae bacterium]